LLLGGHGSLDVNALACVHAKRLRVVYLYGYKCIRLTMRYGSDMYAHIPAYEACICIVVRDGNYPFTYIKIVEHSPFPRGGGRAGDGGFTRDPRCRLICLAAPFSRNWIPPVSDLSACSEEDRAAAPCSPWAASRPRLHQARQMRTHPTPAEAVLWARLRKRQVAGFKFRRQHVIAGWTALGFAVLVDLPGLRFAPSTPVHRGLLLPIPTTRRRSRRPHPSIPKATGRTANTHSRTEVDGG